MKGKAHCEMYLKTECNRYNKLAAQPTQNLTIFRPIELKKYAIKRIFLVSYSFKLKTSFSSFVLGNLLGKITQSSGIMSKGFSLHTIRAYLNFLF